MEKCPILQSLLLIFSFSSSIFSSIIFKCSLSSICLFSFHLFQFFSNFFKYLSSNFLLSHPYNSLAVYFPGNSILLHSSTSFFFSIFSCHLTSTPSRSNSFINSSTFFKFSLYFQVSPSAVNPFHCIKYFSTPLIFFLFKTFSTSHSSTPSTSTGFPSSFFCPLTCSLYHTIQLTLTTRCILIELGNCSFTTFNDTTSSIAYGPMYLSINFFTSLSLNTKSLVLNNTLSSLFYFSAFFLLLSVYLFISSCVFFKAVSTSS